MVSIVQHNLGLPADFWADEWVLGFFGLMISHHIGVCGGSRISQSDKGVILANAFQALSNMNGHELARRFTDLVTANPKRIDFEEGGDDAATIAFASIGKATPKTAPHVEQAKLKLQESGHPVNPATVTEVLLEQLYLVRIAERFGIEI